MTIDEWCQLHDITKANYYCSLLKVFREFLYIPICKTYFQAFMTVIHCQIDEDGRRQK